MILNLADTRQCLTSQLAERARLYPVSRIPDDLARRAYFTPVDGVQAALDDAILKHGSGARVLAMPHGGLTCPVCDTL